MADLTPAWISFQAIVPPWFNACARPRVRNTLFRQSFAGVLGRPAPGAISASNSADSSQCRHCSRRLNHTAISASSRAAVVLSSPCGFSPSCKGLATGMLTRRHCRRSLQEIKYQLCRRQREAAAFCFRLSSCMHDRHRSAFAGCRRSKQGLFQALSYRQCPYDLRITKAE